MPKKSVAKKDVSYASLKAELDEVLAELQREDLDVDTALKNYHRGLELVQELQAYLKTAENKVTQLQAKFRADG